MKDPKLLGDNETYKDRDDVPEDFDSFWNRPSKDDRTAWNTSSKNEISAFQMLLVMN